MTLLAPWAAVIAAGIGVPALLALYFLRLRRATLRVGSTMLWEGAAKDLEVNVPWKMIRPSWLLALQLLALLCLCMAFGRPAVNLDGGAPPRVVVLIDRSASMSAADIRASDGGAVMTRLAMAQRKAGELVEASWRTAGSRVAVASFASSAMVHANWSRDRRMLTRTINELTPTDQPGDVGSAVDLLRALAADSAAEDSRVREAELGEGQDEPEAGRITVFVLSDGGFDATRLAGVAGQLNAGRRVDVRFVRVGPEVTGTETGAASAPDRERGNVGIVSASARRDFDDPGVVRVTARLTSTFAAPVRRTVRVALGREASEVMTETVTIPARSTQGDAGDVVVSVAIDDRGARQGAASADDEARLLRVWITEPDVLASDDRALMLVAPAEKPRVVLVTADRDGAAFLRAFLELTAASPLEVIDPAAYRARAGRGAAGWAGVDLVVLDRVEWGERPPAVATISIGAGGDGLRLVRPAGSAGASVSRGQRAVTWRRDHPVMRDVDLGSVEFFAPATLPIDAPMLDTSTVLVEGVRGPLISAMQDGGAGGGSGTSGVRRVLIAPDLARTTWGADVSFVIFMANAVDWLTLKGQGRAATWFTTGQPARVLVDGNAERVRVRGPLGDDAGLAAQEVPWRVVTINPVEAGRDAGVDALTRREVVLGAFERVGLYRAEGQRGTDSAPAGGELIASNLFDANESSLRSPEVLRIGDGGGVDLAAGGGGGFEGSGRTPREIWHWFVLASLVLLGLEWLGFAIRSRMV
jgi:hypothetical protein